MPLEKTRSSNICCCLTNPETKSRGKHAKCPKRAQKTQWTEQKGKVSYQSPEPSVREELGLELAAAAEANVDGAIAMLEWSKKRAGLVVSRRIW